MADAEKQPPTNLRRLRRTRDRQLLILVILTLVVAGGSLIGAILGLEALLTALPCLLGGVLLILVPWLLLTSVETWRDRMQ